jgi:hypothetical protein
MSTGCLAHPTSWRAGRWACAVGIGLCLAVATARGADASDAVLDPGPVVTSGFSGSAVSSGHGWAVWGRRDALGQVSLVAVRGHGAPSVLAVRPLRRLDGLDVGLGSGGAPTVAFQGVARARAGISASRCRAGRKPGCGSRRRRAAAVSGNP